MLLSSRRRCCAGLLLLAGLALASRAAGAQALSAPRLVSDIHAATRPISSDVGNGPSLPSMQHFARIGQDAFFVARHPKQGIELFQTKGSKGTTALVADIHVGPGHSHPSWLTALGNKLVFYADDGRTGGEPWVYDTVTKTAQQLADIWPGTGTSKGAHLEEANGFVWFHAQDPTNGDELWRTDGTPQGTRFIADINPGKGDSRPLYFVTLKNTVYFIASDGVRRRLYRSDGTAAGTVPISQEAAYSLTVFKGELWFTGLLISSGVGAELYRSDGTAAGTRLAFDIDPGTASAFPSNFAEYKGRLYFGARTLAAGAELHWTDGTQVGSMDLLPGSASSFANKFTVAGTAANPLLYFVATLQSGSPPMSIGSELVVFDGQKMQAIDINPGSANSTIVEMVAGPFGRLFFQAIHASYGSEIWVTSGSQASTQMLGDLRPGKEGSYPSALSPIRTGIVFSADDGPSSGRELWYSDGTRAGTALLEDIDSRTGTESSYPQQLTAVGGEVFFSALDGVHGRELWRSDGTAAGTMLVQDLLPGVASGNPRYLTQVADKLFFVAEAWDPQNSARLGEELHVYDLRTRKVTALDLRSGANGSNPRALCSWRGQLWFQADGDLGLGSGVGTELWTSDGTLAGTRLVKDIDPGAASGSPWVFTPWKGQLYFIAQDATAGQELWVSDGSAAGTKLALDVYPGTRGSLLRYLTPLSDVLVFSATTPGLGSELIAFDGQKATVIDIASGAASSGIEPGRGGLSLVDTVRFATYADAAYFVANDTQSGAELWTSDGTTNGTRLVRDIVAGTFGASITSIEPLGDRGIFFSATDATIYAEPWRTDGTTAGTRPIADLVVPGSSVPLQPVRLGGRRTVFQGQGLAAPASFLGIDFYVTDGTATGTQYFDLDGGPDSSRAGEFTLVGDLLFLSAETRLSGVELFVVDLGAVARSGAGSCTGSGRTLELRAQDPVLGATTQLRLDSEQVRKPVIVLLGSPARVPLPLGLGCEVHLDFALPVVTFAGTSDGNGSWSGGLPIPNQLGLRHVTLLLQALAGPSASAPLLWDLSGSLELHPGR